MSDVIVNKVAESGLITLDLETLYPKEEVRVFDLKPYLFREMVLKEKDFRAALQEIDWKQYENKIVGLTCTADAIIPVWAYMLLVSYLQPEAKAVVFGDEKEALQKVFLENIDAININEFAEKRIVIKGCGNLSVGVSAYVAITEKLRPVVKSIMYGEPCSTVPIYKKK